MRAVFADAHYFIALLDRRQEHHKAARSFDKSFTNSRELVTTEMVLAEFLNMFAKFGGKARTQAAKFVRQLRVRADTRIVPQTPELFESAFLEYLRYNDKECGLTDCASFVTMRELGIRDALTHDIDFVQMGFIALFRSTEGLIP